MISNILSNIFLLIISILKLLSSMYIPLIILTFIIISTIFYLSKRVLVLPCNKCDNGSWWYKCKKDTGYGSETCTNLTYIVDKTQEMVLFIFDIPNKVSRINQAYLNHTYNVLIRWLYFMKNVIIIILKLNPTYFVYKLFVEPFLKIIFFIFEKIIAAVEALSFGFVIPVIDIDINIGKLISKAFTALMKLGELLFNTLVNVFASFAGFIFDSVIQPIIYAISDIIKSVMNTIAGILEDLINELKVFLNQITSVVNSIRSINFYEYLQLVVTNLINWVVKFILLPLKTIPFLGSLIEMILANPYVLFYIVVIPSVIQTLCMFGGQVLSVIALFKQIFYMLCGFDNDLDFIIFILDILESYNIVGKSEQTD